MGDRAIPFTTVFNFRDLGGYSTGDGRTVRWGRLFRADDLSRLTGGDQDRFAALGIRTVVDLRRPSELDECGQIPALDGFTYRHVPLTHPHWQHVEFADTTHRIAYLRDRYREMTEDAGEGIGETLRLIADAGAAPVVFHCIAGKDRTGVVAALALALLGVDDAAIAGDYELSEAAEEPTWHARTRAEPDRAHRRWTHITVSPRHGMLAFLGDLRARYGSVEDYAAKAGVTSAHIAAMRAHLLAPRPSLSPHLSPPPDPAAPLSPVTIDGSMIDGVLRPSHHDRTDLG